MVGTGVLAAAPAARGGRPSRLLHGVDSQGTPSPSGGLIANNLIPFPGYSLGTGSHCTPCTATRSKGQDKTVSDFNNTAAGAKRFALGVTIGGTITGNTAATGPVAPALATPLANHVGEDRLEERHEHRQRDLAHGSGRRGGGHDQGEHHPQGCRTVLRRLTASVRKSATCSTATRSSERRLSTDHPWANQRNVRVGYVLPGTSRRPAAGGCHDYRRKHSVQRHGGSPSEPDAGRVELVPRPGIPTVAGTNWNYDGVNGDYNITFGAAHLRPQSLPSLSIPWFFRDALVGDHCSRRRFPWNAFVTVATTLRSTRSSTSARASTPRRAR